ncbi:MAG TPA: nucleotide exchange factor GrpE [Allosphingosinicella sp.]|nr:nucleotide exchange factor GrpE [Allosphingosinicella sp.]
MNEEDEKIELEGEIDFGGGMNVDRLGELEKELEQVRQHALYAQAETQNVRRRLEQEKVAAAQYAATAFARDMLSVKDNMVRALDAIPEEMRDDERIKGLIAGLEATGRELDSAFQRHGVARIEAMGKPLDPHFHQAMLEVPSDEEPGTIVQEMQAGYTIKERLLRPALVGVAKKG